MLYTILWATAIPNRLQKKSPEFWCWPLPVSAKFILLLVVENKTKPASSGDGVQQ
jgi:hypothetical protein